MSLFEFDSKLDLNSDEAGVIAKMLEVRLSIDTPNADVGAAV